MTLYSSLCGTYNSLRRPLVELQLHLDALREELKLEWNMVRNESVIRREDEGSSSHGGDKIQSLISIKEMVGKFEEGNVSAASKDDDEGKNEEKRKEVKEANANMKKAEKRPNSMGDNDFETPKKKSRKVICVFKKATPKSEIIQKLPCHLCPKEYASKRALVKHLKNAHDGADIDEQIKLQPDKITCKICKCKSSRDLINRHLKEVHGMAKTSKIATFRGFFTLDERTWKPLWLSNNQEDPPEEVMVKEDSHGRIQLYGVIFEPHEVKENAIVKPASEVNTNNEAEPVTEVANNKYCQSKVVEGCESQGHKEVANLHLIHNTPNIYVNDEFEIESGFSKHEDRETGTDDEADIGNDNADCPVPEVDGHHTGEEIQYFDNEEGTSMFLSQQNGGHELQELKMKEKYLQVTIHNFTADVKEGEFWSDSDCDPTDCAEDIETRAHMKQIRHSNRNNSEVKTKIYESELNAQVIEKFENYMNQKKMDTHDNPEKLSTLRKHKGHLFTYDDSMLSFETAQNPDFNLLRLLTPKSESFLELSDPIQVGGWIRSVAGEHGNEKPSRRKECLKSHARFRDFLLEELDNTDFGNDSDAYYKKDKVTKRIEKMEDNINSKMQNLSKRVDAELNDKRRAKEVLYPSNDQNEMQAVVAWFDSKEAKLEEKECSKIYDMAIAGKDVSSKDFTRYANYVRFTVLIEDRNRRSVYNFTNLEYKMRKPKWLPLRNNDDANEAQMFETLPESWDADSPRAGEPPSVWVITVSGTAHNLKGNEEAHIILTRRTEELCKRYREMKIEIQGEEEADNENFFVNKVGRALAPIQKVKGSLLQKLGMACNIVNPTVNTLRRATEHHIQNSPVLKASVEKIQHHSAAVGLKNYDKSTTNVRASFIHQVSSKESPFKENMEVSDHLKKKRSEREERDMEKVKRHAQMVLTKDKVKKGMRRTKKMKVKSDEREFLQKTYESVVSKKGKGGRFPGNRTISLIFFFDLWAGHISHFVFTINIS